MMFLSILLQDAPANTTTYMIAGYGVIFGTMLVYLVSMALRQRNLSQDYEMLKDLDEKE